MLSWDLAAGFARLIGGADLPGLPSSGAGRHGALLPLEGALVLSLCPEVAAYWFLLDGATVRPGPVLRPGRFAKARWKEVVVAGGRRGALMWRPGTEAPEPFGGTGDTEVGCGTCVGRGGGELRFFDRGAAEPFASHPDPLPAPPTSEGWSGLHPVCGGRAVVFSKALAALVLVDPTTELGRAAIPEPGRLFGIAACPSGRVVALQYQQRRYIDVLDLRSAQSRRVTLDAVPRSLSWSPSGQILAVPSAKGVLHLLRF